MTTRRWNGATGQTRTHQTHDARLKARSAVPRLPLSRMPAKSQEPRELESLNVVTSPSQKQAEGALEHFNSPAVPPSDKAAASPGEELGSGPSAGHSTRRMHYASNQASVPRVRRSVGMWQSRRIRDGAQ
ncbi:hypothetical protein DHEL01_v211587 [Diaporthe helianthi]|uniref:Uncharacterized protein n=1 Tax=Diaporthe helianthi TaxID=158607 RepID=A0A2P5HID6_DIAHE|nr:hypothetical protein DHEL01_v211587 [Diaporthe helianthi]